MTSHAPSPSFFFLPNSAVQVFEHPYTLIILCTRVYTANLISVQKTHTHTHKEPPAPFKAPTFYTTVRQEKMYVQRKKTFDIRSNYLILSVCRHFSVSWNNPFIGRVKCLRDKENVINITALMPPPPSTLDSISCNLAREENVYIFLRHL